jgi:hypothetical protein
LPIDRAVTLRNAEKLIRQGKLDAAIAEFVRIVEDQPQDWNAKNTLGDLFARAGQVEAIDQFMEIADNQRRGAVAGPAPSTRRSSSSSPTTLALALTSSATRASTPTRAPTNTLISCAAPWATPAAPLQSEGPPGSFDPEIMKAAARRRRIERCRRRDARPEGDRRRLPDKCRPGAPEVLTEAAALNADDEVRRKAA